MADGRSESGRRVSNICQGRGLGQFAAHDSKLPFGGLNHGRAVRLNRPANQCRLSVASRSLVLSQRLSGFDPDRKSSR